MTQNKHMKSNLIGKLSAGLLLAALMSAIQAPSAHAVIYTFQQGFSGYTGATSTYTQYGYDREINNYGGNQFQMVHNRGASPSNVTFQRWDLSSITAPVDVTSASLTIYFQISGAINSVMTYNLYPILRTGLNFGTADDAPQTGTVTFSASSYDPGTPIGWGLANSGTSGPVAGEDYSLTSIGSFSTPLLSPPTLTFALDPSTVESWINTPASNLGFVIVGNGNPGDRIVFYSKNVVGLEGPVFTVDAAVVPEPSALALLGLAAASVFLILKRRNPARSLA